jgi:hypothetical protein
VTTLAIKLVVPACHQHRVAWCLPHRTAHASFGHAPEGTRILLPEPFLGSQVEDTDIEHALQAHPSLLLPSEIFSLPETIRFSVDISSPLPLAFGFTRLCLVVRVRAIVFG